MAALSPAARLLAWCAAGSAIVYAVLARIQAGNPDGFSPIFWYLLSAYDQHGNLLLLLVAVGAFFLRRRPSVLHAVALAARHPWAIAALMFALLGAGSLFVYQDHPLAMDEYTPLFQARAFAAGALAGNFPPSLIDRLVPQPFQGMFFVASRATGDISSTYWPGFALLLAPFAWLGIPWAANPLLGALAVPAIHRLASRVAGSSEAGGWAVLLAAASPAFVVASISYYPMAAHLLGNLLYALLLLHPTVGRAFAAGMLGGFALALHNPVPHILFAAACVFWLATRPGRFALLGALAIGYLPLALLLGMGWKQHLVSLVLAGASAADAVSTPAGPTLAETVAGQLRTLATLPGWSVVHARIAGLSKMWTWGATGLLVLAAYGYRDARRRPEVKLLGAALAITFFAYFLVRFDQGHGWGYRYVYPAWFVLPVLASIALVTARPGGDQLRAMACWAAVLSLVLANGLRLTQVEIFITGHRKQVPPLVRPAAPGQAEIVFVHPRAGPYAWDLVQNDPFLRGSRITMVSAGTEDTAEFMAQRYPAYRKSAQGSWGELWTAPR